MKLKWWHWVLIAIGILVVALLIALVVRSYTGQDSSGMLPATERARGGSEASYLYELSYDEPPLFLNNN